MNRDYFQKSVRRWKLLVFVLCWMTSGLLCVLACGSPESSPGTVTTEAFRDISEDAGLVFSYFNGMSGELYISEIMGGAVALFDFDNDGDLDVYLGQGHMLDPSLDYREANVPPTREPPFVDRLFRNDIQSTASGTGELVFVDVTYESRIHADGYGMGVATGDFDNDGWVDLYITNHGPNQLWHNNGDGTFSEITQASGAADSRWSTSAAAVDFDRDGWLDLFVVNYIDFDLGKNLSCLSPTGLADYCSPHSYTPLTDRLLRNKGDGTFEDVSLSSGIASETGNGLGVVVLDSNLDGWLDLYVANDLMGNFLWINMKNGSFVNESLFAGCAVDQTGQGQSSMGVDCGDVDNDGDEDLVVAHMVKQNNTLYLNDGTGLFWDSSMTSGLGQPSIAQTAYATVLLDFDLDGWLDLFTANGSMIIIPEQAAAGIDYPLEEADQLFRNLGSARFTEVSALAPVLSHAAVSRGSAAGDLDNDGDPDIVVSNSNSNARVLLNQNSSGAHWVGLRIVGGLPERYMLGALVTLETAEGRRLSKRVRSDGSYCSARDPRVLIGIGASNAPVTVTVRWPNGDLQSFEDVPVDCYSTFAQSRPFHNAAESGD